MPNYFEYARKNIICDCPLCLCPNRDTKNYSFVYVKEALNIIYFDIPKCASKSIRSFFFNSDNDYSLVNPTKNLNNYIKFTFVRNPWARMVSNWKMFTTIPFRLKQLRSMTADDLSEFGAFVSFAQRVKNHHWQPQSIFLPGKLDFIGNVETFEKDFNTLCSMIGIKPGKVPHENRSERSEVYSTYYTNSMIEQVAEMYSEDIEKFGYQFEG